MRTNITNEILGNSTASDRHALKDALRRWRDRIGYFSIFAAVPAIMASQTQDAPADVGDEPKKPEAIVAGPNARFVERLNSEPSSPAFLRRQSEYRLPHQRGKLDIVSEFTGGGDNCPGNAIPAGIYTAAAPYTDSGDTTGANNTVNGAYCYYCPSSASGPDQVYSFTLAGRGPNPQIVVTGTSGNYRPKIYLLDSRYETCPTGTGSFVYPWAVTDSRWVAGSSTATFSGSGFDYLPLNTPLYLFIDSEGADANGSGGYTVRMQDLTISPAIHPGVHKRFDFNGDGVGSDLSVFQPSTRTWRSDAYPNEITTQFGLATDKLTPADYDGDAKTDIAIFRDGHWWRINSSNGTTQVVPFGQAGDIPVPIDYTGDGRDEVAIYRDGNWWMLNPANNQVSVIPFGVAGDKPVPADYDGDGKADQAVYRNGEWHLNRSTQGYAVVRWGIATDIPVPADYDGDGKTDPAVYRNGTWYLLRSTEGPAGLQWGLASDVPAPADYSGDRRAEYAVFRNGQWYILYVWGYGGPNNTHTQVVQFGAAGDKPIPSAYLP